MLLAVYGKNSFIIPYICFTTTLSAAAGGLTILVFVYLISRAQSIFSVSNGILAGLVSISAGCAQVLPTVSIFIGAIGALIYLTTSKILKRLEIDDPLNSVSIHGACGLWGVWAAGIFDRQNGLVAGKGPEFGGICLGIFVITIWIMACAIIVFFGLKICKCLRINEDIEEEGLDV